MPKFFKKGLNDECSNNTNGGGGIAIINFAS